jgi:hypothetical protein
MVLAAKDEKVEVEGRMARIEGRPPPKGTLYASLPPLTQMGRLLDTVETDPSIVDSLRRELQRAGGIRTDEPE